MDGTEGYVLKKDLNDEQPCTPQEAIAQQNSRIAEGYDIPLCDMDGKNVIGVFRMGGINPKILVYSYQAGFYHNETWRQQG
ncbi:hypothetical protein ABIC22_004751 [Paenibacillus sp. PvP094]